jgi:hypothetical protein
MASLKESSFIALPVELRLRIYEHALRFPVTLVRPLRASVWGTCIHGRANISILCANKQILAEARDVFYEANRFRVSYNQMCYCENQYPYHAFDARMSEVEINHFMPRIDEPRTCEFCFSSGYGLVDCLRQLPKVKRACVSFEDVFSYAEFAPMIFAKLTENGATMCSKQIGRIEVLGFGQELTIALPAMHSSWQYLAHVRGRASTGHHHRGERAMRRALEYLQFEANTYDRTARTLLPFFTSSHNGGTRSLRFQGIEDGDVRRAEFTLALAGVLHDIFQDDGGAESVDWVEVPESITWTFFVDNYRAVGARQSASTPGMVVPAYVVTEI